jgi:hypothetical protein
MVASREIISAKPARTNKHEATNKNSLDVTEKSGVFRIPITLRMIRRIPATENSVGHSGPSWLTISPRGQQGPKIRRALSRQNLLQRNTGDNRSPDQCSGRYAKASAKFLHTFTHAAQSDSFAEVAALPPGSVRTRIGIAIARIDARDAALFVAGKYEIRARLLSGYCQQCAICLIDAFYGANRQCVGLTEFSVENVKGLQLARPRTAR